MQVSLGWPTKKIVCFLYYFLVKNECFMHVLRSLGVGRAEKTVG